MGLTNFPRGVASMGVPILGGPGILTQGDSWFVKPLTGSDGNDGKSPDRAFKTVAYAHSKATAYQNDVVYLFNEGTTAAGTADVLTSALTWSKSMTHLIGVCAPIHIGQRCRINTTTLMTPMVTLSGSGCIIANIQFMNDGTHATDAAVCMYVSGSRNYFQNCQFGGRGALAVVDNSHRDLVLASSNGENTFFECTIGNDTMDYGTATNYVLEFNGANETARNQFINCLFLGGGSANAAFILATTVSSLSSFQLFKDCTFYNNDNGTMDAMNQAFNINSSAGGQIILQDCLVYGAGAYETSNSGLLYGRNAYAAATSDVAVALTY